MDKLNTAIIGTGGHARGHLQMINNAEEMHLLAVCDINEERLERAKAEYGAEKAFTDYREMIDKCDLDVAYVVTQPEPTADISVYCLESGLHTSVEKPPGLSSSDTRRILEAEKNSDGIAIVSLNRRYIPEVLAVRKMVLEHGGPVHCAATYNKPITVMRGDWGKSLLICDAIHHVDLLRWLAGDAVEVYSESYLGDSSDKQRHSAVIRFANGCRGVMMSHYAVGFRIQRAEVHAENFSAYLDLTAVPKCELYEDGKPYEKPLDIEAVGGRDFNETRHFIECIKENKQPWSNLEDVVRTMELCEAILQGVKGRV
jgi:predicted dehydrogenase